MFCPFCGAEDTKVVDSRLSPEGDRVKRRRECTQCHERFTTFETAELNMPYVIKKNGNRAIFDEKKLRRGMQHAVQKRPVSTDQIDSAIAVIKRKLLTLGDHEVASHFIGELVMEALHHLDQVAYVRFASVYRRFEDVSAFREVVDVLQEPPAAKPARGKQLSLLDNLEKKGK